METIKFIEDGDDFLIILNPRNPEREKELRLLCAGLPLEVLNGVFSKGMITPDTSQEDATRARTKEKEFDAKVVGKILSNTQLMDLLKFFPKGNTYKSFPPKAKVMFWRMYLNTAKSVSEQVSMINSLMNAAVECREAALQEILELRKRKYESDVFLITGLSILQDIKEKIRQQKGAVECTPELLQQIPPEQQGGISKAVTDTLNGWYTQWH